jgi:hypothetical protein
VIFKKLFLKVFYIYLLLIKLINKKKRFLKIISNFFYIFLSLKKLVNEKYFSVKEKFRLIFRKVFSFYLGGKHFLEIVKKLKMSYYLLIISNLILKLFIVIYILF